MSNRYKVNTFFAKLRLWKSFDKLMLERSVDVVDRYSLQKWFRKTPMMRRYHVDIVDYIRSNVSKEAFFLETGCGIGQTFVVLSRDGYRNFTGVEKDWSTVLAARDFLNSFKVEAEVIHGDGLMADTWVTPCSKDVYLPLNWTYFTSRMDVVFEIGIKVLKGGGLMVIDVIKDDYIPTSPKEDRVYENYPHKYSKEEVIALANSKGYILQRVDESYGARSNFYFLNGIF